MKMQSLSHLLANLSEKKSILKKKKTNKPQWSFQTLPGRRKDFTII